MTRKIRISYQMAMNDPDAEPSGNSLIKEIPSQKILPIEKNILKRNFILLFYQKLLTVTLMANLLT